MHDFSKERAKYQAELLKHWSDQTDGAHDLGHIHRVWKNCLKIAAGESIHCDLEILIAAAFFHDLVNLPKSASQKHMASKYSAKRAAKYLSGTDFPNKKIPAVQHANGQSQFPTLLGNPSLSFPNGLNIQTSQCHTLAIRIPYAFHTRHFSPQTQKNRADLHQRGFNFKGCVPSIESQGFLPEFWLHGLSSLCVLQGHKPRHYRAFQGTMYRSRHALHLSAR